MTAARQPILVIEANADLGRDITDQLLADTYPAQLLTSAHDAAQFAQSHPPRAVIIGSLGSPRAPLTLLRHIRRPPHDTPDWTTDVPVIMLTASRRQTDLLRAFDAGADDVLTPPPSYLELRARLRAVLRRADARRTRDRLLRIRSLMIDTASREVTINGRTLHLRRLEYDLLAYLASEPRRVFHRRELLINLWGYPDPSTTRTLDAHASRLRRKLRGDGERWVVNIRGVGYRLI
ncbi:MAG TPA: response regulator transcription factor [Solirubrobacteraceae bacterium]|nr:response regulator transcription factor [Solirubrobacteraceae bacterium]